MSRLILILGCHRSGTSLIAGALQCFGVELGPRADWRGPDNEKSFNEDQDVLALHESMLKATHQRWYDRKLMPVPITARHNFGILAHGLLAERLERFPLFAIKEPRMCRLLPLWKPVFAAVGTEVSIIHAVRHPVAVARSLEARNAIPLDHALALWLDHVRRAQIDSDPLWPSVVVDYNRFMDSPLHELDRIGRVLDLELKVDETTAFLRDSLRPELRHQPEGGYLPPEIADEWSMLQREAAL